MPAITPQAYDIEITVGTGGDYSTWTAFNAAYASYNCATNAKRLIVRQISNLTNQGNITLNQVCNSTYYVILDCQGYTTSADVSYSATLNMTNTHKVVLNGHFINTQANSGQSPRAIAIAGENQQLYNCVAECPVHIGILISSGGASSKAVVFGCVVKDCPTGIQRGNWVYANVVNCTVVGCTTAFVSATSGPTRFIVRNCVAHDYTTLWSSSAGDGGNNAAPNAWGFGTNNVLTSGDPFTSYDTDLTPGSQIDEAGMAINDTNVGQVVFTGFAAAPFLDLEGTAFPTSPGPYPIGAYAADAGGPPPTGMSLTPAFLLCF